MNPSTFTAFMGLVFTFQADGPTITPTGALASTGQKVGVADYGDGTAGRAVVGEECRLQVDSVPDWRVGLLNRLDSLACLADGWDGDAAPAPAASVVAAARRAIDCARWVGARIDRVAADVEGGIVLYAFGDARTPSGARARHGQILLSNDNEAVLVLDGSDGTMAVIEEIGLDDRAFADALRRLSEHVAV